MNRVFRIAWLIGPLLLQPAHAQEMDAPMRAEWTLERTGGGHARIAGYVHNRNGLRDGINVSLRVERLGADGAVAHVYRTRVVGDVRSGGRLAFAVPVATDAASYRVLVDSVDWVDECR